MPRTGRPREFDEQEVVRAATQQFWSRGYEATSVQDLVAALGLQRGSLYGAFGDKRTLFLRALDAYICATTDVLASLADEGPLLPRLREVLVRAGAPAGGPPRGCLMGNAAIELAGTDEAVAAGFAACERAFRDALERAYASGELPPADAAAQAGLLLALLQGLNVVGRTRRTSDQVGATVDAALAVLTR